MLGSERVDFAELEGDCAGSSPRVPSIHRSPTLRREFLFGLENAGGRSLRKSSCVVENREITFALRCLSLRAWNRAGFRGPR
jgi:hypothetical protein